MIKGRLRSKSQAQVLAEFSVLLDQGVFEVILIAQDLGDFGKDRGEKNGLEKLLREILKEKRPFWLRLLYLYPDEITDELIAIMKDETSLGDFTVCTHNEHNGYYGGFRVAATWSDKK